MPVLIQAHSLHNSVHSFFQFQWACLSKLIFRLTDKSNHPSLLQPNWNLHCSLKRCDLISVTGGLWVTSSHLQDPLLRFQQHPHAQCSRKSVISSPQFLKIIYSQAIKIPFGDLVGDHCVFIPCWRTWSFAAPVVFPALSVNSLV